MQPKSFSDWCRLVNSCTSLFRLRHTVTKYLNGIIESPFASLSLLYIIALQTLICTMLSSTRQHCCNNACQIWCQVRLNKEHKLDWREAHLQEFFIILFLMPVLNYVTVSMCTSHNIKLIPFCNIGFNKYVHIKKPYTGHNVILYKLYYVALYHIYTLITIWFVRLQNLSFLVGYWRTCFFDI